MVRQVPDSGSPVHRGALLQGVCSRGTGCGGVGIKLFPPSPSVARTGFHESETSCEEETGRITVREVDLEISHDDDNGQQNSIKGNSASQPSRQAVPGRTHY